MWRSSQSQYQPYSYDFYQKLDADVYSTSTREHTSMKPYFVDDSILKSTYDSLMNYGNDGKKHSWGYQKLFNEHLIDFAKRKALFMPMYCLILQPAKIYQAGKENTGLGILRGTDWRYGRATNYIIMLAIMPTRVISRNIFPPILTKPV